MDADDHLVLALPGIRHVVLAVAGGEYALTHGFEALLQQFHGQIADLEFAAGGRTGGFRRLHHLAGEYPLGLEVLPPDEVDPRHDVLRARHFDPLLQDLNLALQAGDGRVPEDVEPPGKIIPQSREFIPLPPQRRDALDGGSMIGAQRRQDRSVDTLVTDRRERFTLCHRRSDPRRRFLDLAVDRRIYHGKACVYRPIQAAVASQPGQQDGNCKRQEEDADGNTCEPMIEDHVKLLTRVSRFG